MVIRDLFPKGLVHWLVLPRLEMVEEIGLLNASHLDLLHKMSQKVKTLEALARAELKDEGAEFLVGFHSMPSMKLLHLHFISAELGGARLSRSSHWISFTTSFFIPLDTLIQRLTDTGETQIDTKIESKLKKAKPQCPICNKVYPASDEGVIQIKAHYSICYKAQREAKGKTQLAQL
jgi:aprataxin